jgi:putative solute:sodium symporter small subunit
MTERRDEAPRDGLPGARAPDLHAPPVRAALDRYWRNNLRAMAGLLALWAAVSFGAGILFADWLNQFRLPLTGFPLGFWFAQQGSIVTFVLCILLYCVIMNRLDRRHHEELQSIAAQASTEAED